MAEDKQDHIVAFTDGAARGNPGPGGWGAIVWTPDWHVRELGDADRHTTNNRMELLASIAALEYVDGRDEHVRLHTDSTYVIQGITSWIFGWKKRGWKTAAGKDVLNQDLWKRLHALASKRGKDKLSWHYVRGHVGTPGNERCDAIATGLADGKYIDLYDGPFASYSVDLTQVPEDTSLPKRSSRGSKSKGGKTWYLSEIGGDVVRHQTWGDCERRVKGRSGARFKKVKSEGEEAQVLDDWGVSPPS